MDTKRHHFLGAAAVKICSMRRILPRRAVMWGMEQISAALAQKQKIML